MTEANPGQEAEAKPEPEQAEVPTAPQVEQEQEQKEKAEAEVAQDDDEDQDEVEGEEEKKQDHVLEEDIKKRARLVSFVESPYPDHTNIFDGEFDHEDSAPDLAFVVQGRDAPLMLHARILKEASDLVDCVLQCRASDKFEWQFDTSSKKDLDALFKVLGFCYGETLIVEPLEVPSIIAALWRLQVKCAASTCTKLAREAVRLARAGGAEVGTAMLLECLDYDECCNYKTIRLDLILAGAVLTRRNMAKSAHVHDCLAKLPLPLLADARFSSVHDMLAASMEFVEQHKSELSHDEKRALLGPALCSEALESGELAQLAQTGLYSEAELLEVYSRSLQWAEKQSLQMLLEHNHVAHISTSSSKQSHISTRFPVMNIGGAAIDDAKHVIVGVIDILLGQVFVTPLNDATHGTQMRRRLQLPFKALCCTPVFDGADHMYFMETGGTETAGVRFGRLSTRTWEFQELPRLPPPGFTFQSSGCWHCGVVYAVDTYNQLCGFDVASGKWARCGITLPTAGRGVRLLSNPHDNRHIYAMVQGSGLHEINLADASVELLTTPPVAYDFLRAALIIGCDADKFVLVASLRRGAWHAYESHTNTWCRLAGWKPTKQRCSHNFAVYSPSMRCVYYMVNSFYKWFVVPLP